MNIPCEIVQDLLPIYKDDVCSVQSRKAVDEHLQKCEDCKSYLAYMNDDFIENDFLEIAEKAKYATFKEIKKKLFRKNVMVTVISILFTVGLFSIIFNYQIPISYKDGMLSVEQADDKVIDIYFYGDDYYTSYGLTKTIEKNGTVQNVAYIYYTDSIWTKYFSNTNNHSGEKHQFSIGNSIMVDYSKNGKAIKSEKDISAVYYLIGDYQDLNQMSDAEFAKNAQQATLLWEK